MASSGQVFQGYWSLLLAILPRPAVVLGADPEFAGAHLAMWLGLAGGVSGLRRLAGDRPFLHLLLSWITAMNMGRRSTCRA